MQGCSSELWTCCTCAPAFQATASDSHYLQYFLRFLANMPKKMNEYPGAKLSKKPPGFLENVLLPFSGFSSCTGAGGCGGCHLPTFWEWPAAQQGPAMVVTNEQGLECEHQKSQKSQTHANSAAFVSPVGSQDNMKWYFQPGPQAAEVGPPPFLGILPGQWKSIKEPPIMNVTQHS